QTALLAAAVAWHWSRRPAYLLVPPYLGFQLFAWLGARLLAMETAARDRLAAANATLVRLQAELADQSRADERLRIAQELLDALGHRLTALTLNLEVAAHQTVGAAHDNVRTAQALVRSALQDVRDMVLSSRPEADFDLLAELRRIASEVPAPAVHVHVDASVHDVPREGSHALLRCAQEVVTNAIQHGQARNVWLELSRDRDGLALVARDDGHGADDIRPGNGLIGMRRRFEELGGTLRVETRSGGGFVVRATLPAAGGASV